MVDYLLPTPLKKAVSKGKVYLGFSDRCRENFQIRKSQANHFTSRYNLTCRLVKIRTILRSNPPFF